MSSTEQETPETQADTAPDTPKLLLIAATAAAALAVLVAFISLLLIVDMRGDVAIIEEFARRNAKAIRSMQEDLAEMKAGSQKDAPKTLPAERRPESPRPSHVDAADPSQDCVIRSGDTKGFAECLKSGPKGP